MQMMKFLAYSRIIVKAMADERMRHRAHAYLLISSSS
jgi:hypothetical protein